MKKMLTLTLAALLMLGGCDDDRKPDTTPDIDPDVTPASSVSDAAAPGEPASADAAEKPAYEPITAFAPFDVAVFADLRQQAVEQGKVLVIDFWATWCGSCVQMFPILHEAMHQGDRHDKVMLVSVTQDAGEADIAKALKYVNRQEAGQGAYLQGEDAVDPVAAALAELGETDDWGGSTLPAVFVFDKQGQLAYAMTQTEGDPADWVAGIAAAADAAAGQ